MAFDTAYPQILANLAAGNQPIATVDSNFTPLYNGILSLNTFSNYYVDSGAANAYVVTITARQSATLAAGLAVQFLAAHVNTGASTLNVNGTGAKNILNPDGSALSAGQIPLNAIVSVIYDGTQYQILSGTNFTGTTASTFTFNGSGGSTGSLTMTWQKVGNFVTLNIPGALATTGTNSSSLASNTALPTSIRPASTQRAPIGNMIDNVVAVAGVGMLSVGTNGIVTIFRDGSVASFTNSAQAGMQNAQTFTYFIG